MYFGGPGADATADLTMTGEAGQDLLGWSVSGAGDVNGDGVMDVLIGLSAPGGTPALPGGGYVVFG